MILLSQRDDRWKNTTLGSKGTIGEYGCTITCIAMLTGLDPLAVNEALKRVGGYSQGNLIIWSKLNEAIPGLHFIKRAYTYNNTEVANNLPCLVEVDGTKIGGVKHWVLFVGNGKAIDPWTGKEVSTSHYPPLGYATMRYESPNNVVPAPSPLVITDQTRIPQIDNMEVQAIRSTLGDLHRENKTLASQVQHLQIAMNDAVEKLVACETRSTATNTETTIEGPLTKLGRILDHTFNLG